MPQFTTVLYPNPENLSFDMVYYLEKHMPLTQNCWSKYGLKEWKVIKLNDKLNDGSRAPYSVQATTIFENAEGLEEALVAEDSKIVFEDIANFTNTTPLFLKGPIVGESGA
jgi:uncharacterized protein (TIGR02118 family)